MRARSTLGLVALALAIGGFVLYRSTVSKVSLPASKADIQFPDIQVQPAESVDSFLNSLESEPFRGLGLVRATPSDNDLMLGWTRQWVDLPSAYRQDLVGRIGEAWGMYYGGRTLVFAVPSGDELARYTPGSGLEVVAGKAGR